MPKRNLIGAIAIVAAAVVTVLLTRSPKPPPSDGDQEGFRPVVRAYRALRDNAYRPPADGALQRAAVRGMAEALDGFSSYIPPERVASFRARLGGHVVCVGLVVDWRNGAAEVIGALPGSPASQAGIEPGGHVVSINGRPAAALGAEEVRAMLEGPGEQAVQIVLVDRAGRRRSYSLAPRRVALETVTGLRRTPEGQWEHWVDPAERIAFLRIKELVPGTTERVHRALRAASGARAVVLDLRDNPGGRLEDGYAVANLFLRGGVVFTKVDRRGDRQSFAAQSDGTMPDVPMVVLVNEQTASAAEIVAGALRLHDRAVLVGTRTRGKGLVQSMISLPDQLGQANLTTGEFFLGTDCPVTRRPGAKTWGVEPHRRLELSAPEQAKLRRFWMEMDVMPARPAAAATSPATSPASAPSSAPAHPAVLRDRQLAVALELLRARGAVEKILAGAAAERKRQEEQQARRRRELQGPGAAAEANQHD